MNLPPGQWLPHALASGCLHDDQPLACFLDTQGIRKSVDELRSAFPPDFRHAFAAKANAMRPALKLVRDAGMHCEVASLG